MTDFSRDTADVVAGEVQGGEVGQVGKVAAEVDAPEKVPGKVPRERERERERGRKIYHNEIKEGLEIYRTYSHQES